LLNPKEIVMPGLVPGIHGPPSQRQSFLNSRLFPQPSRAVTFFAVDVSVQAQVLNLLLELQLLLRLTFIFVAHDLSVVRHISDRVAVMYVGQIVELATTEAVFARPRHPYTAALMRADPVPDPRAASTGAILKGEVPSPAAPPSGCYFHPRCPFAEDRCRGEAPLLREVSPGHFARCHFAEQLSLQAA
jgi:peptide/nickel transport system ATP-binding protein